jgi:ketosteroid isomerase-like protein
MTMTVREAFEKGTATFNAHDLDGFAKVLDDNVAFKAPGGIHGEGKAACAGFFASWFATFPDARVEVHAVHIFDDLAVEEGKFIGTQNGVLHGPMGDIPPTGRPIEVDYVHVLRFRDGKHVSFNLMFDRLMMLEQLGLLSTPAVAG